MNKYYKIHWIRTLTKENINDLIENGQEFKITGGYSEEYEVELYHNIIAKNDKQAIELTKKWFENNDEDVEIFSLIKFKTDVILTEEDFE